MRFHHHSKSMSHYQHHRRRDHEPCCVHALCLSQVPSAFACQIAWISCLGSRVMCPRSLASRGEMCTISEKDYDPRKLVLYTPSAHADAFLGLSSKGKSGKRGPLPWAWKTAAAVNS